MAVAFDANMTAGNGGGGQDQNATGATTVTTSTAITVGAGATLLVVTFTWGSGASVDPTSRTCTWDGVSMTEGPTVGASSGVTRARASIFTLVNPASGAKALTGNWTGACDVYMSATSFTGTDTVTGIQVSDSITTTATTTITPTSDANGATVACFSGASGSIPTTNFNKIYTDAPFNQGGGASYQLAGASNAHTFTGAGSTVEALAAVHIIAAVADGISPANITSSAGRYIGWTV